MKILLTLTTGMLLGAVGYSIVLAAAEAAYPGSVDKMYSGVHQYD